MAALGGCNGAPLGAPRADAASSSLDGGARLLPDAAFDGGVGVLADAAVGCTLIGCGDEVVATVVVIPPWSQEAGTPSG